MLVSALDADEWPYTAGVAKVLASALDAGELLYTAGVAESVNVSTRCKLVAIYSRCCTRC